MRLLRNCYSFALNKYVLLGYGRSRPKAFIVVLTLTTLACTTLTPKELVGEWYSSSRLALAKFGEGVVIADRTIAWGGKVEAPTCISTFSIESEPYGTTFKNVHDKKFTLTEHSQFKTFKLRIKQKECVQEIGWGYLRLTLFPVESIAEIPYRADIVMYGTDGQSVGWTHLHKYNKEINNQI